MPHATRRATRHQGGSGVRRVVLCVRGGPELELPLDHLQLLVLGGDVVQLHDALAWYDQ